jgi:uncharacterized C2H2 Zn-finger protein
MPESKMTCPRCGMKMNLHAEKIDYTVAQTQAFDADEEDLGGILEEIHTCPACGDIETRRKNGTNREE